MQRKSEVSPIWDGGPIHALLAGSPLWDFQQLGILKIWQSYSMGQGVNAYVIDSGVTHHPLLEHRPVNALSFMTGNPSPEDGNGHGTWVCGKIGARGVGLAPECNLTSLRVLGDDGSGEISFTAKALEYVLGQPDPHIINMSLGSFYRSGKEQQLMTALANRGVIVVAAAGNENTNQLSYPAAYSNVLAIAAINEDKSRAYFSNYGEHIAVSAPGVSCYSTYLGDQFRKLQGTSMASPTVAGLMILGISYLLMKNPKIDRKVLRAKVINALLQTASDLGTAGKDQYYGFGEINGIKFMEKLTAA